MGQLVISVNESEFGKAYSKMMSAVECLGALSGEFRAANANLSNAWEGHGGSSFAEVAQKMEANFAMLEKGLSRLAEDIQYSYDTFSDMDNRLGGAITAGGSGVSGGHGGGGGRW